MSRTCFRIWYEGVSTWGCTWIRIGHGLVLLRLSIWVPYFILYFFCVCWKLLILRLGYFVIIRKDSVEIREVMKNMLFSGSREDAEDQHENLALGSKYSSLHPLSCVCGMGKTALLISSTSFAWRFWFFFSACWEVWTSSAAFGREGDHISLLTSRLPLLGLDLQLQVSTHMQNLGGAGLGRDRRSRRCRGAAAHFLTGGFWRARSWGGFLWNA